MTCAGFSVLVTSFKAALLLRLPVGRGGIINSPRSIFLGFFSVSKVGLALMGDTAGTKLCEPIETRRLINGGICQHNLYFNMYTTISKPQEGCTCKDSHAKCFITTNSTAKLWPGAVNRSEL